VQTNAQGTMDLGDWSKAGILNNYSGGVKYQKTITLTEQEVMQITTLDLGKVIATAEVSINGKKVGVRVAPPWQFDLSDLLKAGENRIEVTVFNTLSNHYQTIHNLYRGEPTSGLLGPVRMMK
jgi:beta-galactosidase/beta-glucuronidase